MAEKYIQELNHYSTVILLDEMEHWEERLRLSQPIDPAVIGYLLGRAKPVWVDVECRICKEKIVEGEEHKPDTSLWSMRERWMHKSCFEKAKEEEDKRITGM